MAHSNIAFPNLRAEMARKGVSIQDIARELKKDRTTIGAKPVSYTHLIII